MIKVLDSSLNVLAILQNVVSPVLSEDINREFTFDFTTVIDMDKSQYITYTNKVEVEDNYFNIIYFKKNRTMDNITLDVSCEHVSYDLLSANFTTGFTATGVFSAVATTVLSGTGFTIGTVEITASQTISINEATNGRNIMFQLAALYGGELKFDKYAISLLTRRGADNGVQFRYRKNISAASVIVDNRKKVGGLPTISYEVDVAELEFEQGYIAKGYSNLERYELGDTIRVIDEDLDIDISLRIVKESHDPEQRMQGTVEISNFVDDISDTLTQIQTTSVAKNNIYNGCSIGPDDGFVAERSDGKAKTIMNATEGISIYSDTGSGLVRNFFVDTDGRIKASEIDISGSGTFAGTVTIGTGNNVFVANGAEGIWLGNAVFANAPFRVNLAGAATADNLLLTGGVITIGITNNTFRFNETDGLWLGNIAVASAPFKINMAGALTATDAYITGTIEGSEIIGGTIEIGTADDIFKAGAAGIWLGNAVFADAPFSVGMSGNVTASNLDMTGGSITGGSITVDTDIEVGEKINIQIGDFTGGIYWNSVDDDNLTCDPGGALTYTSHFYASGLHATNGADGSFTVTDGTASKTVTVQDGIIVYIE